MAFNLEFEKKYILHHWSMLFHPAKVSLNFFQFHLKSTQHAVSWQYAWIKNWFISFLLSGNPMNFNNFVKDQPDSNPYAHMDYDLGFSWNAKDDANDKDNGFICKRPLQQ